MHIPKDQRGPDKKVAPKSWRGCFVGYPPGFQGYLVLNETTGADYVTYDVVFDETFSTGKTDLSLEMLSDDNMHELLPGSWDYPTDIDSDDGDDGTPMPTPAPQRGRDETADAQAQATEPTQAPSPHR